MRFNMQDARHMGSIFLRLFLTAILVILAHKHKIHWSARWKIAQVMTFGVLL